MSGSQTRPRSEPRGAFLEFHLMQTRWSDMDIYGHVNNVVYLQYCDAALNRSLIAAGALDLSGNTPIGVVAQNTTHYFSEIAYPDPVTVGVRVQHIGNTSLTWGFGIFRADDALTAAVSSYVHVYIDRQSRRPLPLTPALTRLAQKLFWQPNSEVQA